MKNKKGFTLIELLAVITILGLLIVLVMSTFTKTSDRTKNKLNNIMLTNLKDAAAMYAENGGLRDCHNCDTYSLNVDCVSSNTIDNEKIACQANGININLKTLKQGGYFSDDNNHCYGLDINNKRIKVSEESNVIISVYRYNGDYIVNVGNIKCVN